MGENLPQKQQTSELAVDTATFSGYLQKFGLPTDNIIASTRERAIVAANLAHFLEGLPPEERRDARYLSKFVGATAIGLFDAALNFIWNEVVLNLRKKTVIYGVDLFFDAAVGGNNRASFKDEEDLAGLKDSVLLNSCLKLELISDVVYRKLDHILTMRNEVAASHPNVESIGGYELLGWLQTCVKDVLQERPSESAIKIKSLVENIKTRTDIIDAQTAQRFRDELKNLSLPHVCNLLIRLFGIFIDPVSSQILRANIATIVPAVWQYAPEDVKFKIGATIDGYRTNLRQDKLNKGSEFLTIVNGRMYETIPTKTIALEILAERLDDAHDGYNNFYTEPPIMREILQFCQRSNDIPQDVLYKLVKVVLRCRLGRGLSYQGGVSPAGLPLYDQFLGILDDNGIIHVVISLFAPEINSKLDEPICQRHLQSILAILRTIAVSERLKQVLDFLIADIPNAHKAKHRREFRDLSAPLIKWN
jgi:hypothetical protein